jgi:hypothetical protein
VIDSEDLYVTKLVDFIVMVPEHLSLHFYDLSVICYAFLKFTTKLRETCTQPHKRKKKNYNWVLRRPSPQPQLASGVLLGRAYRCCDWEARWVEEFESYLPMPAFGAGVVGIEVVGVNSGGGVRVASVVVEGGLGAIERRAHEYHESVRKLLG